MMWLWPSTAVWYQTEQMKYIDKDDKDDKENEDTGSSMTSAIQKVSTSIVLVQNSDYLCS